MISARNVSDFFLSLSEPEAGDTISNLKMQKLLYYAQGYYFALYNKPLFQEKIIAWQYGPVVKEVYEAYSEYSHGSIPKPRRINLKVFDEEIMNFLKEIYQVYGQYSALRLMQLTHGEPPWKNTNIGEEITLGKMGRFFKSLIKNE
ncbi:MAG TPA: type II toxin-antitoxin system antitoxin SocA domain-containing protein [Bacteroidales bacterium]|nr:type II toxin-antitoxin system antitoxin SocA domain-containing protein [Bacteroidales bacterium]